MNKLILIFTSLVLLSAINKAQTSGSLPHLKKQGTATQLIVHDKPFLIIGGELGNSSASSTKYMNDVWPTLVKLNVNTVLMPVYWELTEPTEGNFDFSLLDKLILSARENNLHLVLLWFGSWKNSMSCYAPGWVKTNQERFPRSRDDKGNALEILTAFSENNLQADLTAFQKLMQHLEKTDGKENTVIMVQVENEIGMIPTARDYCAEASKKFTDNVPEALINYLTMNKDNLMPELYDLWKDNGFKTKGSWEDIFGKSKNTDELFMCWYYADYVEKIAKAGKAEYSLPMYVNAALIREGYEPGQYPSAGPLPHLMDVWRAGAPSVDFISPDIYFPNIEEWCNKYDQKGNPIFVPEARREPVAGVKAFYVLGNHDAIGFSPFSIESTDNPEEDPIGKAYRIIDQLKEEITAAQGNEKMAGILLDENKRQEEIILGGYKLIVKHDFTLGWSPNAKDEIWPAAGGLIINTAPGEYYVAGSGIVINFETLNEDNSKAGILEIDEGEMKDGRWVPERRMNGDQSHQGRHLRIPDGVYGIQKVKLYTYK